jgi:hypothetical protein
MMDKVERPDWLITATAAAEAGGMSRAAIEELVGAGDLTPIFHAGRRSVPTQGAIDAQAPARRRRARRASSSRRCAVPARPLGTAPVSKTQSRTEAEAGVREARANLGRWEAAIADAAAVRRPDNRPEPAPLRRLTIEEAAAALGMLPHDALHAVQSGRLAGTRLGREWITTSGAVAAYLRAEMR